MANVLDVVSAEKRCVRLVVNGSMKLKFALMKVGLNYKSNTSEYHRVRRQICKEIKQKKQKTGAAQYAEIVK